MVLVSKSAKVVHYSRTMNSHNLGNRKSEIPIELSKVWRRRTCYLKLNIIILSYSSPFLPLKYQFSKLVTISRLI